jgi:pyridoxine 5-phosphate synthase
MKLLVNIDHVATLRNARGEGYPDPVEAAHICEQAGAAGIVFHLRGDRRHIRDEDVYKLKKQVRGKLDFEMAATDEMLEICTDVAPHLCTLVPEGREELTTEGGLKMESVFDDFEQRVFPALRKTNTEISLFLDPNPEDIRLAHELGTDVIELHTGTYANADAAKKKARTYPFTKSRKNGHRFRN